MKGLLALHPTNYPKNGKDFPATQLARIYLLLALIFSFSLTVGAVQASDQSPTVIDSIALDIYPQEINFRNIMQDQGIALGEVEAITQDHQGFMWLGGRNALLRYDGYEFLTVSAALDAQDTAQMTAVSHVLALFEDSRQDLWVATRTGLYKYDPSREILLPIRNGQGELLFREAVYALAESPAGELLIATGSGLHIFNTVTVEVTLIDHKQDDPQSLPSNILSALLVDGQGRVWLGLDEGLVRINWKDKQKTLFVPDPANPTSVANNGIRTLAVDPKGDIWAGSDNGIYRLNPDSGAIKSYRFDPSDPYSLAGNLARHIYVDRQGWVWIGTDGGGISLYDQANDRFLRFAHQEGRPGSLSSSAIRSIYEDSIGDLWVGTYPSGINVYDRSTAAITVLKKDVESSRGLLSNNVEAVEEDNNGNLWIGAGGVTRYDPIAGTLTHYRHIHGTDLNTESISVLNGLVDSDGEIRFGSWAHGVLVYNAGEDRFETVPADPTLVKRGARQGTKLNDLMVWSVYEDKRKNLWLATHFNGLTRFDKKTGLYTYYSFDPGQPNATDAPSAPVVWTTFEDSQGRFWVGTANGLNLMDLDLGTFKRYMPKPNDPRSLADRSVLSINEDHQGRLWFGTDAGLHLYHPETDDFTVYSTKDGFANQGIRAILEDQQGNLWLGTNNGIVMFNPDTAFVRNYTGYNGELIGGIATGAAVATSTGEMAFGTRSGLYIFNANRLVINTRKPLVVLTDFRIFTQKVLVGGPDKILTKAINQTQHITLDYTKSMLSFSFAALNYRDPEKNQYAYKLEGFDDEWREVGNQRTALYTNLPAGTYQFHVKASNNDGVWNTQGRSLTLTILPPPWRTWWAYSLYLLIGVSLLLFFVYSQHKKVLAVRRNNRELEIKVTERTAELRNKNAELEEAYAQLETVSLSDPLTGLSNRRYLQKLMPMDIAKVQREYETKSPSLVRKKPSLDLTFFLLDIDYFKSVNDTYGHMAGDQLLIHISDLLTAICRESDCVVRWGGEEFLIVSRFTDREEALPMAERIRLSIEQYQFELPDGTRLTKTCSIGFACFPYLPEKPMALPWEQVIDVADHALYAAKKSGRNRSVGLTTNANTREDMLYRSISSNLKILIDNNELTVVAISEQGLVWD